MSSSGMSGNRKKTSIQLDNNNNNDFPSIELHFDNKSTDNLKVNSF